MEVGLYICKNSPILGELERNGNKKPVVQYQVINIIANFASRNKLTNMLNILGNIIAFVSTFVVITTLPMTFIRIAVATFSHSKQMKERTESIIVAISMVLAIMLIPFYYYPY
jgi:hypothetical protein